MVTVDITVLVTVAGALVVALLTWRTHMIVARRRLTYESIQNKYWDVDYVIARRMFNDYRQKLKDLDGLEEFFEPPSINHNGEEDSDCDTRISVFERPREFLSTLLNDYELFSIGIANNVIDENMAKSLLYTTVMKDYTTCRRFIQLLRDRGNNPRVYIQFEKLYERWKVSPPKPKSEFGRFRIRAW